jgi:carboxypeptidase family protein/TonB-dependent receptor-like protein
MARHKNEHCSMRFDGRSVVRTVIVLALIVLTCPAGAWAQSTAINGTIRGHVSDASSAAVPDAIVTVENKALGFTRSFKTNQEGYYVIPNLPLGTYELTVTKQGFANLKATNIKLTAGSEAVIDAPMKVSQVETTIEVFSAAPIVESTQVNIGRTISEAEIQNLPLPSRNPYNFILFQPGVSGHPNQELGIPRTINTNGLLDRINYQMDGMVDSQGDRHGLRLLPISDSFVREVQTVSNSYAPEFGMTAGNIYNVITNSGTNDIHGMFQWQHRWIDATAKPILATPTTPKPEQNSIATNAGGRVIKDKLFWFGAYEHVTRIVPQPINITTADAAAIGISPSLLGAAPGKLNAHFANARLDWVINRKNTAFLRYNYFRNDFPVNTSSGSLSAKDAYSDFKDRAHAIGMQLVTTFTPSLLNEFRFSWPYRNNSHFAGQLTGPGPAVNISGIARFNGTNAAGDRFNEKIPNLNENLTWSYGTHSFKFGGAWQEQVDFQRATAYTEYTFASIPAYQAAKSGAGPFAYTGVTVSNGGTLPSYKSIFFSIYGQDSWQITPKLTANYGLRYDKFLSPPAQKDALFAMSRNFNSPSTNFSPRLGIAYRLKDKTTLRASGGIFYEAPATNTWFNTLLNNGTVTSNSYSPTSPGAPAFPANLTNVNPVPGSIVDIVTLDPNFQNAYVINTSLQLAQELSKNDAITLAYVHTGGRNLEYRRNINLINPIGTTLDGRPIFSAAVNATTRIDPRFNNIIQQATGANSNYDALVVSLTHRMSRGFQMSASYTWSHSISDAPDANSFEQNLNIQDATDLKRDRGNSTSNRPHALTLSALVEPRVAGGNAVIRRLLNDNNFAILGNFSSGDQFNLTAGRSINGDSSATSVTRPVFVGRNSYRGANIYQIDVRYTRTIASPWERVKPQFLFEVSNIFNHPNYTAYNTAVRTNTSGQPVDSNNNKIPLPTSFTPTASTVLEGRLVQFGLAVRF